MDPPPPPLGEQSPLTTATVSAGFSIRCSFQAGLIGLVINNGGGGGVGSGGEPAECQAAPLLPPLPPSLPFIQREQFRCYKSAWGGGGSAKPAAAPPPPPRPPSFSDVGDPSVFVPSVPRPSVPLSREARSRFPPLLPLNLSFSLHPSPLSCPFSFLPPLNHCQLLFLPPPSPRSTVMSPARPLCVSCPSVSALGSGF